MKTFQHKFVEYIPDNIEEGVLYISIPYKSAAHNCFCGCGNIVYTPLIKGRWSLIFQAGEISLYPSIGSANLECRSHYFLTENTVEWMRPFSSDYKAEDLSIDSFSIKDLMWQPARKTTRKKRKTKS
jgi:hypothetical protein